MMHRFFTSRLRALAALRFLSFLCLVCAATLSAARADIIEYIIPNTRSKVLLQGRQKANPGRTITYTHPKFGNLILGLEDVPKIHEVPPMTEIFSRKLGQAVPESGYPGPGEQDGGSVVGDLRREQFDPRLKPTRIILAVNRPMEVLLNE